MKKIFLLLTGFLIFSGIARAQVAQPLKPILKKADMAFEEKDYYSAYIYYHDVILTHYDSTDILIWYKTGESARLFQAFKYAELAYKRVLSSGQKSEFPLSRFWLAEMEYMQGKYPEARNAYNQFLSEQPGISQEWKDASLRGIEKCDQAIQAMERTEQITIQNIGTIVNTPESEFAPYYLGNTLFYSSMNYEEPKDKHNPRRTYAKAFASIDGGQGTILPMSINQPKKHVGNISFNTNKTGIYYTVCEYKGDTVEVRCDLYFRKRTGDTTFGPAHKLSLNANGFTSTQPNVAIDEASGKDLLFFASDRPGGKGGADIWCAFIERNDTVFSQALPIPDVNTAQNEYTPFYHKATKTLYFSSDGYPGLGALDIYKTTPADGANGWKIPEHLNHPINSSYNDLNYFVNEAGDMAYFSSNRLGSVYLEATKEVCCNDIYVHPIDLSVELEVFTFDQATLAALAGATIELFEITDTGEQLVTTTTNPVANDFKFPLERYKKYKVRAVKQGYTEAVETIDLNTPELASAKNIRRNLYLMPERIDLEVTTFYRTSNLPLPGATLKFYELTGSTPRLLAQKTNDYANDYVFPVELGKKYLVVAEKKGFQPEVDTLSFTRSDVERLGNRLTHKMYLGRVSFDDFLPLTVFFDNDHPDPKSRKPTTDKDYEETYHPYYGKKQEFRETFTEGMNDNEKFLQSELYDRFFDRDVKGGYDSLMNFSQQLQAFLAAGNSVNLEITGYSSPKSTPEYNNLLSSRRVWALKNHFERFNGGVFKVFIDNGQLTFSEKPLGESEVPRGVSDSPTDVKNSIFSVLASVERRVEISRINIRNGQ